MAKIKQSPKLPAGKRREQLLASARKLFTENGYRGTSTEQIAQNAGLTKGALYFHFSSKEEILLALVQQLSAQFLHALHSLPKPLTPGQIVDLVVCHTHATKPKEFRTIMDIWVQGMRIPRIRKFIRDEHNQKIAYVLKNMDRGMAMSSAELEQMVVLCFAVCDGIAGRRVFNNEHMDQDILMKLMHRMFEGVYQPVTR